MELTPENISSWVASELKRTGRTQEALAKHLGLNKSAVTRIVNGTRREYSVDFLRNLETFFGSPVSPQPRSVGFVAVAGRIGEIWTTADAHSISETVVGIPSDIYPYEMQRAYRIDGNDPSGEFRDGDYVVCVPLPNVHQSSPMLGDTLVIRRISASGLESNALKRVDAENGRLIHRPLFPILGDSEAGDVLGLVIGLTRPYKRT